MSAKILKGSTELGNKIRLRRNELGFTIEEAASKAGVGTKTWSRYESGKSIRRDKVNSICKTLNWHILPNQEESEQTDMDINDYKCREIWPHALAETLGEAAAISSVIGSDILLDNIEQDLEALSCKPKGTHIGELNLSWLEDSLPPQFLMQYDYDFLYYWKTILIRYRNQAAHIKSFTAHTVIEELTLYIIMEKSKFLMEGIVPYLPSEDKYSYYDWSNWPFDLFDDMDIITFLYSDHYLEKENLYHFEHWRKELFYAS